MVRKEDSDRYGESRGPIRVADDSERERRFPQRLGPYRKQRGEKTLRVDAFPGPRWFRYGALKEAFSVWHESAMCFEYAEPADRVFGS